MDKPTLEQVDRLLASYFAPLKEAVEDNKLDLSKLPPPKVTVPEINLPTITVPDIHVPEIHLPPIVVPKPEVTVNVDKVKVENWPEFPTPQTFDDSRILKALKALLNKTGGGGGGSGAYMFYDTVTGKYTDISPDTPLPIYGTSVADTPETFEDTSFVTGDSPKVLDCNAALGRNGTQGYVINDGAGDFTVSFSTNGSTFGDEATLKKDEMINFKDISVDSIRITWIADSSYRVSVV